MGVSGHPQLRPASLGTTRVTPADRVEGCILGLALGDALGLPFEVLPRRRVLRRSSGPLRHRLLGGWGMLSDDTDHAELVLLAALAAGGDADLFSRRLASGMRSWFLALPAGVGMATARACLKLCVGVPHRRVGVFSAGNGPLMRAPVIGVLPRPWETLADLSDASARLTHTDPQAASWSRIVARTANLFASGASPHPLAWLEAVNACHDDDAAKSLCAAVARAALAGRSTPEFAAEIGCGERVSGFVLHTGPVVLHAALVHTESPMDAITACIACGGDTDTTAAIAGAIVAARTGPAGLDAGLLGRIADWPRGLPRLRSLARLAGAHADGAPAPRVGGLAFYPLRLARNLAFLAIILTHGLARLIPGR